MSTNFAFSSCRPETAVSRQTAVERLILAMRQNVDQPMSLQLMAEKAMVSSSHLDHIFRQATGISPRRFMGALRLTSARRMLLNTELKVIDICLANGYNSLGTFTRRFTKLVGVPPLHLRRLPENGVLADMRSLYRETAKMPARENDVHGHINAPPDFLGLIFVGLFDSPIPEGRPVKCAVLTAPGPFSIHGVPDRPLYAFAMGFRWSDDPMVYLRNDSALRASASPAELNKNPGSTLELHLRPPELSDPPILLALPALVAARLAHSPGNQSSIDFGPIPTVDSGAKDFHAPFAPRRADPRRKQRKQRQSRLSRFGNVAPSPVARIE
jgi:AraC family transcriptional regulator